ncbi:MAG: GntR family transcriptional regulator [Vallitalea sp.]|jgi:GntR family transcriptional regulator|nr:GntR family transcriptional regulator [Vallitalea sp.]
MIHIDLRSREPIYEQLIQNIKKLIFSGVLKPDEKLPSVRELASQLTINPNTIQKAYKELENQGYIYSARGRGNFIMPINEASKLKTYDELVDKLNEIIREANYMGMSKETIFNAINIIYEENQ